MPCSGSCTGLGNQLSNSVKPRDFLVFLVESIDSYVLVINTKIHLGAKVLSDVRLTLGKGMLAVVTGSTAFLAYRIPVATKLEEDADHASITSVT
ncbi:hypothetical protein J7T55_014216 [Diaporthe amygdali]|uniref:uncharacterized protein n=1 Tax=Phomopsis amygdali TaxID=1214568 RepID=UPI0022FDE4A5|nr:uncharacterized protein J7T55_014216 [Diaporthe amygdali]KAJ0109654.1 hypothetical protein J7T55_014216 [Diaporthe amygdali]